MVSSFSTPGFPHVHTHPTRLPAMDARLSAAIDSLVASMRADLHAIRDSDFALCKALDSAIAPIRCNLALLRHDLALGAGEGSGPASMFSDAAASIDLGHKTLQNVGQHDGDGSPQRISSVTSVDSVPPLLSSSPLLRAIAISPVQPHSNLKASMATHTNNNKPFFSSQEAPTSGQGLGFTPTPMSAINATDDSFSTPLLSDGVESLAVDHNPLLWFGIHDGECSPPRIQSSQRIEFPRFSIEDDPFSWISRAEQNFAHFNTSASPNVKITSSHLDNEALQRFCWRNCIPAASRWEEFTRAFCRDFGPSKIEEYGDYWSFNSQIICLCMLPSKHTNTTKRRHEVLTSFLSNFKNRMDKLYWILQFILAYYTGVIVIMYEDFLTNKCGWVNWYLVGKIVKKEFYALELFDEMSKRECEDFRGTYLEFIFSLKYHREINFGALTVDLHDDFPVLFTSNLDFRPVWDPGDALAQAVKLMLYLQCKKGKHMDNLFDVQRLLHLLTVSRNIRGALLYEIERYKKKALVEQLGCLDIQLHCSDFHLETNNEENWSKEHNGAIITVAMFLFVCTNVPIIQESSIPQYMAEVARHVIMVAPDTAKGLGCIARSDEGLVQFQLLDHRLKLVKRNYEFPTLYTMDWRDIEFRISEGVDLIAMSVVNSAESVKQLKNHLFTKSAKSIRVFAKIESLESLQNLEEIIEALDRIKVARVDLGVEIPLEQIPTVPEGITNVYRQLNKLVTVAYQFLELVIEYPTPTHAKVADVSEAVRHYAFNIVRSISIVESLFDAFSQQWFSVKLIYALCCLLILILGIVGMHYVVNLVGGSKEPIKSMAAIESIALVLAYFTNKRIITLLLYYGGRIGYGKENHERLLGKWEVVDVNDCCSCALYLVDSGKIYGKHLYTTKNFYVEGSSTVSSRKPVIFADETCATQTAALGHANFAHVFVQGSLTSVRNRYQLLIWAVVHTADEGFESITHTN